MTCTNGLRGGPVDVISEVVTDVTDVTGLDAVVWRVQRRRTGPCL
jgi:hypothetical protein